MKKAVLLLGAVLLLITVDATAQINDGRWFAGGGIGLNVGVDGQKYMERTSSHIGAGFALDLYAGKFFTERWGFRVGYHGLSTSDQYTVFGHDRFHYIHADALFHATDAFIPYAHAGVAFLEGLTPAGGLGLMMPIQLTDRVKLVPDLKATFLNADRFADGSPRLGLNLSAMLGVAVQLGERR